MHARREREGKEGRNRRRSAERTTTTTADNDNRKRVIANNEEWWYRSIIARKNRVQKESVPRWWFTVRAAKLFVREEGARDRASRGGEGRGAWSTANGDDRERAQRKARQVCVERKRMGERQEGVCGGGVPTKRANGARDAHVCV